MLKKKFYFIFLIFLLLPFGDVCAVKYYQLKYIVKKGETYSTILNQFLLIQTIIDKDNSMMTNMIKKNTNVESWDNLTPGIEIFVYIRVDQGNKSKLLNYISLQNKAIAKRRKNRKKKNYRIRGSVNYLQFSVEEKIGDGGANTTMKPMADISSSFIYYKKIKKKHPMIGTIDVNFKMFEDGGGNSIPFGYSLNLNVTRYRFIKKKVSIGVGVEYESFSNLSTGLTEYYVRNNAVVWPEIAASFDKKIKKFILTASLYAGYSAYVTSVAKSEAGGEYSLVGWRGRLLLEGRRDKMFLQLGYVMANLSGDSDAGNIEFAYSQIIGRLGIQI